MNTHRNRSRSLALALACTSFAFVGCMQPLGTPFETSQPELVAFGSCGELEQYLRTQAFTKATFQQNAFDLGSAYEPFGFIQEPTLDGTGSVPAPTPEVPFSTTNNQETGVNEADIFKVDSTHAFALHGDKLVIIGALGESVPDDGRGGILRIDGGVVVAEVDVPGSPFQMHLYGDKVVVLTRSLHQDVKLLVGASAPDRPASTGVLRALIYDVRDRTAPVLEREVAVEGTYLSSRRIGEHVYIVSRSSQAGPAVDSPVSNEPAWLIGRELLIRRAGLDSWLPYYYDIGHTDAATQSNVSTVDCSATYASRATNGDQAVSVLSVDVSRPESAAKTTTILGDGAVVYASTESLVVAITNFAQVNWEQGTPPEEDEVSLLDDPTVFGLDPSWGDFDFDWGDATSNAAESTNVGESTYLHRFRLADDGSVSYHATGRVDGYILNQFSISEYNGYLRVATNFPDIQESNVFVLQATDKTALLQAPLGAQSEFLNVVGSVRGIASREDLYATRFQGDVGYLVTFRQVDPLWIIDMNDPTAPRVRGELMVPGYSTYLQPIEGDKLLAIGRAGLSDGIKLSLFDVSDLDRPRAIDEREEGSASSTSEALEEHRAFRYLPEDKLLLVPMTHSSERGLYAYKVDERLGFEAIRRIDHSDLVDGTGQADIRRAYRIGDYFYAYSGAGVTITRLSTLETVASIDLPDAL